MHNVTMAPTRVVPSSVCGPPTTRTTYVRPKLPNLPGAQASASGITLPSPLPSQCEYTRCSVGLQAATHPPPPTADAQCRRHLQARLKRHVPMRWVRT
jgi:hypothetical protein